MTKSNQDRLANGVSQQIAQIFKQLLIDRQTNAYCLAEETGIDRTYLGKLFDGEIAKPGQDKLAKVAGALNIELQQLLNAFAKPALAAAELNAKIEPNEPEIAPKLRHDWGNAPDGRICYGRKTEIDTLERWIVEDRCRVVTLFGLGGIGKSTLAIKIARQIEKEFDYIFWRSFDDEPQIEKIVVDMLTLFIDKQVIESSLDRQINQLLAHLRKFRCLLILDGVELTLTTDNFSERNQTGDRSYIKFFRQIAESQHQSCLLLTSNEKPREMAVLESASALVRSLQLKGLDAAARNILKDKQLIEEERWDELIAAYCGYPLALKIVATTIKEVFDGSVSEFMAQNTFFLGDLEFILHQEYQRLSNTEKKVICAIACRSKSLSISQLSQQLNEKTRRSEIIWSLDTLKRRSLVEIKRVSNETLYAIHPIVKKYLISQC